MPEISMTDVYLFNPGAPGLGIPIGMLAPIGPGHGGGDDGLVGGPIGGIVEWPAAVAPADWLLCDGTLYAEAAQPALFAVIGHTFIIGGDPAGFFRVPDLRGRIPFGAGSALPLGFNDGLAEAARNPINHGHAAAPTVANTPIDSGTGADLEFGHVWDMDTCLQPSQFVDCNPGATQVAQGNNDIFNPGPHCHLLDGAGGTGWGGSHLPADLAHAHAGGGSYSNVNNWPTHMGLNFIIRAA